MFITTDRMRELRVINHAVEKSWGNNSYDLRLHENYTMLDSFAETLSMDKKAFENKPFKAVDGFIVIKPQESILVRSIEIITVPQGYIALLSPRSNLSYVFDLFHSKLCDTGFEGFITMRIKNPQNRDLRLPVGLRFSQIMYSLSQDVSTMYKHRPSSKNLDYFDDSYPTWKLDKEYL